MTLDALVSAVAQAIMQVTLDRLRVSAPRAAAQLELVEHLAPIREDDLGRWAVGGGQSWHRRAILPDFVFAPTEVPGQRQTAAHNQLSPPPLAPPRLVPIQLEYWARPPRIDPLNDFVF